MRTAVRGRSPRSDFTPATGAAAARPLAAAPAALLSAAAIVDSACAPAPAAAARGGSLRTREHAAATRTHAHTRTYAYKTSHARVGTTGSRGRQPQEHTLRTNTGRGYLETRPRRGLRCRRRAATAPPAQSPCSQRARVPRPPPLARSHAAERCGCRWGRRHPHRAPPLRKGRSVRLSARDATGGEAAARAHSSVAPCPQTLTIQRAAARGAGRQAAARPPHDVGTLPATAHTRTVRHNNHMAGVGPPTAPQ